MSELPKKTIDELRLIDDEMFRLAAADTAFCQEIINTLTDSDVKVIKAEPQKTMVNLYREVTVDVLCEDDNGRLFNCEVQLKHEHDDMRRCRYHAASILTNKTKKGTEFADIPDVSIVYISAYDALGTGQSVTRIKRYISFKDNLIEADDGEEIYFANTAIKDGSRKSALLQLFLETEEPDTDDFPATKGRIHYLKNTEEGRKEMSDAVLEYAKEYSAEAVLESSVEACIMLCKKFDQSKEDAIEAAASLNSNANIQTIKELVCKNW